MSNAKQKKLRGPASSKIKMESADVDTLHASDAGSTTLSSANSGRVSEVHESMGAYRGSVVEKDLSSQVALISEALLSNPTFIEEVRIRVESRTEDLLAGLPAEMLELGTLALDGRERLAEFLQKPHLLLGGVTPISVLGSQEGRESVMRILAGIEYGFVA